MRELNEQEIKYRNQKCSELCPSSIDMVIGFDNGFITGLDHQDAINTQLLEALKMVRSLIGGVTGDMAYFSDSDIAQIDTAIAQAENA